MQNFRKYDVEEFKKYPNVDLNKVRDTQFDNRNSFNIDTRLLDRNDMNSLKSYINKNIGDYQVSMLDNGATRKAIYVKRKIKKIK